MSNAVTLEIVQGDVTAFDADVLALKYAQASYGVDDLVASRLEARGVQSSLLRPDIGHHHYLPSMGTVAARAVLFMGTQPLHLFEYAEIREFAGDVLTALRDEAANISHLAMTIHGPGYGLDEVEACLSQVRGYLDALYQQRYPNSLQLITIVDRSPKRVARLRDAIGQQMTNISRLTESTFQLSPDHTKTGAAGPNPDSQSRSALGPIGLSKNHIFVAMPFNTAMEDVYYYGIKGPVNALGYLCERVDHSVFTGAIVDFMFNKIESASLVVADLTGNNANVFLEIGYAWGKGRPTILLTQQLNELPFDTKGHRCLEYQGIRDLEQRLTNELAALKSGGYIS